MAKKKKKKKKNGKSGPADPVEAVRSAVERTFQVTSEGAAGTRERTRELVDEVAGAAARIRQTIEDLRVLEDLRGLRSEVETLSQRVAALEAAPRPAARARGRPPAAASKASGAAAKEASASSKSSGSGRPAAAKT